MYDRGQAVAERLRDSDIVTAERSLKAFAGSLSKPEGLETGLCGCTF